MGLDRLLCAAYVHVENVNERTGLSGGRFREVAT
jgi:hypothetical protein